MTDETETEAIETETEATETVSQDADSADESDDDESDDESAEPDDESAESDGKKSKKDKPRKAKVSFEASMPRNEAVSYFEAIIGGLRSGRLEFRQEGDTLILNPPDQLEIEVKALAKGRKGKVVFEIEWSDENRGLEILN